MLICFTNWEFTEMVTLQLKKNQIICVSGIPISNKSHLEQ